jgi:O-antigen/teichoic acid export membrane protein
VFFVWQAFVGLLQSVVMAAVLWQSLPAGSRRPRFSAAELRRIGGFTFGLTGIGVLSFLLMQADRIILSRMLPLDQFGVYVIAASVAAALTRLVAPWFNAIYPRFSELQARGDEASLRSLYHVGSQWLAVTVMPAAAVIAVFPRELLQLWTRDASIASAAAPLLSVLICGTSLNGLMNLPYAMQLAHGWTALALRANVIAVCLLVPAIWLLTKSFGAIGAAFAWLALNVAYVVVVLPVMNRRILQGELATWYLVDVGPPALISVGVALLLRLLFPSITADVSGAATLSAIAVAVALAAVASARSPRRFALDSIANLRARA